jgi:hypothetical protein
MLRAAQLDVRLYEEVEHDESALGQAMLVVVISSVAAGIGAGLAAAFGDADGEGGNIVLALVSGAVGALIGWFIWALLMYIIGTTIFRTSETQASLGQLLRTLGFAASPGVLRIFSFVPIIGWIIGIAVSIWMLVTMIIAVRAALDFSTGRAIGTALVGFIVQIIFFVLLAALFAVPFFVAAG